MRYLHQRYSMPYNEVVGILTDVGTEELAHLEMISAILYQLTRNLSPEEIEKSPMATYFVDHTAGIYPVAASGVPFDMKYVGIKGDILADLNEDLAADGAIAQKRLGDFLPRKPFVLKGFSGTSPVARVFSACNNARTKNSIFYKIKLKLSDQWNILLSQFKRADYRVSSFVLFMYIIIKKGEADQSDPPLIFPFKTASNTRAVSSYSGNYELPQTR